MRETTVADETAQLRAKHKAQEARDRAQCKAAQNVKAIALKVRELEDAHKASGLVNWIDRNDARVLQAASVELMVRITETRGDGPASVIGGHLDQYVQILNGMLERNIHR